MSIKYLKGDATSPKKPNALICHVCNDEGGWGAGFVLALSKKWKEPEKAYREWFNGEFSVPQIIEDTDFKVGNVQFIPIFDEKSNIWVANMIAQNGTRQKDDLLDKVYLNYDALNEALKKAFTFANKKSMTIHMPRICCGLAGGSWDLIEPILQTYSDQTNVDTFIYDFDPFKG